MAGPHARRASRVVVPSQYTATEVIDRLGVPCRRVLVCPPGAPEWRDPVSERVASGGYVLFIGTLEPAYGRLLARRPNVPNLVLAGRAGPEAQPWLDAIARAPFAGHVEYLGYVGEQDRQRVYAGARVLVLPSYEEGFGMPALEAMSLGIPVVATNRGALPELVRDAAMLIAPEDVDSIVTALDRVLTEDGLAANLVARGLARARQFEWRQTVRAIHAAFEDAIDERAQQCRGAWRHGHGSP
ncbi:MAG: glycosyltransferase family 4 protein [Acidobacteria bacterium]|nr:glycosyltransferase family 4 protein [Acidobacteriota bacterium]